MRQVYTTSTGVGNRIENKEKYLYKKDHRAIKEARKALPVSSMTIYITQDMIVA